MNKQVGTRLPEIASEELEALTARLNTTSSKILRYSIYRLLEDSKKDFNELSERDQLFFYKPDEYLKALDGIQSVNGIDAWKKALKAMDRDFITIDIDKAKFENNLRNEVNKEVEELNAEK